MSGDVPAIVILVSTPRGRRYFYRFGKRGQIQTAWSLAGAALFAPWRAEEIEAVEARLAAKGYRSSRSEVALAPAQERDELEAEIDRLRALLNAPELHDFAGGVVLEAAHQRERWGADHDAGKAPADWFWLVGFLAGKALHAAIAGDRDKALHHFISAGAALANWHAALLGVDNRMRPGISPPPGETAQ